MAPGHCIHCHSTWSPWTPSRHLVTTMRTLSQHLVAEYTVVTTPGSYAHWFIWRSSPLVNLKLSFIFLYVFSFFLSLISFNKEGGERQAYNDKTSNGISSRGQQIATGGPSWNQCCQMARNAPVLAHWHYKQRVNIVIGAQRNFVFQVWCIFYGTIIIC